MTWIGSIPFEELSMTENMIILLEELAEDSEYWRSASSFIHQVKDRELSTLSDSQRDWIGGIMATLTVELDRRTAKDVFGPDAEKVSMSDIKDIIGGYSDRRER